MCESFYLLLVVISFKPSLLAPYRYVVVKIVRFVTVPCCPASSQDSETLRTSAYRPMVPKLLMFSIYFNPLYALTTSVTAAMADEDVNKEQREGGH